MKSITFSIDEDILKLGREYARRHKLSFTVLVRRLIGRRGPYPGACSGKSYNKEQEVQQSLNRGMDHASTINFLSNEDTPELTPVYFIESTVKNSSAQWLEDTFPSSIRIRCLQKAGNGNGRIYTVPKILIDTDILETSCTISAIWRRFRSIFP